MAVTWSYARASNAIDLIASRLSLAPPLASSDSHYDSHSISSFLSIRVSSRLHNDETKPAATKQREPDDLFVRRAERQKASDIRFPLGRSRDERRPTMVTLRATGGGSRGGRGVGGVSGAGSSSGQDYVQRHEATRELQLAGHFALATSLMRGQRVSGEKVREQSLPRWIVVVILIAKLCRPRVLWLRRAKESGHVSSRYMASQEDELNSVCVLNQANKSKRSQGCEPL